MVLVLLVQAQSQSLEETIEVGATGEWHIELPQQHLDVLELAAEHLAAFQVRVVGTRCRNHL
jgi:hypothetical protein